MVREGNGRERKGKKGRERKEGKGMEGKGKEGEERKEGEGREGKAKVTDFTRQNYTGSVSIAFYTQAYLKDTLGTALLRS